MWKQLKSKCQNYLLNETGATAVVFAFTLPVLVAAGGLSVDLAKAYNVQNRLGNALDKAALAAANSTGNTSDLEARMNAFFDANFPDDVLGDSLDLDMTLAGNKLNVTATARVETSFMNLFGKNYVTIDAETEVVRELSGIEIVMVLDVTGSMAGTNLTALKTASTDFMNIMFSEVEDDEYLKIGIVPYSSSVNVGPYGLGYDEDDNVYGSSFVTTPSSDPFMNPNDLEYSLSDHYQWGGCVLTDGYPNDTRDDATSWEMYRYPEQCTRWRYGYCQSYRRDPNYYCPVTPVVPMTSNQTKLQSTINALNASGYTYGNIGMVWGWRLISPEAPFTEGVAYDEKAWDKVIVMMTDGQNTMHNYYSAYGRTSSHSVTPYDLNERLEETCDNIKEEGVRIYTVTFQSGINDTTKGYYRRCATSDSMYFHAPTNSELVEVFQNIANQLSKLHITK